MGIENLIALIGQMGLAVALVVWYTVFERPRMEKKYEAIVTKIIDAKNHKLAECSDLISSVDKLVELLERSQGDVDLGGPPR